MMGLPETVAALLIIALNAYALSGGADFGGGVWDLLARGPRKRDQRALVAHAIGPIWEANHVWLIIAIVILFTAFPPAFAALGIVLHIPLSLMLIGIILRGSAFVFRSYGARERARREQWGRVFSVASTVTPVLLGIIVGAIATGHVGDAAHGIASASSFHRIFVAPWLAAFPVAVGFLTLALFAFLAAVYMTVAVADPLVREDFRRYALFAAGAVFVTAFGTLAIAIAHAPHINLGLTRTIPGLVIQGLAGIAALTAILALVARRWKLARAAAASQVTLILWGWVFAQYPYLIPPGITIRDAAAPAITLRLVLWGLAGGSIILVPSLIYLFRTFATAEELESKPDAGNPVQPG